MESWCLKWWAAFINSQHLLCLRAAPHEWPFILFCINLTFSFNCLIILTGLFFSSLVQILCSKIVFFWETLYYERWWKDLVLYLEVVAVGSHFLPLFSTPAQIEMLVDAESYQIISANLFDLKWLKRMSFWVFCSILCSNFWAREQYHTSDACIVNQRNVIYEDISSSTLTFGIELWYMKI